MSRARKKKKDKRPGGEKQKKDNSRNLEQTLATQKLRTKSIITIFVILIFVAISAFIVSELFLPSSGEIAIVYPFNNSVFPPEIIAPKFIWRDTKQDINKWQIVIRFNDNELPIKVEVDTTEWIPERNLWEMMKQRSLDKKTLVTIHGLKSIAGIDKKISKGTVYFSTSKDSVAAPIFYRDVPLPFSVALKNVDKIRWRLGNIASYDPPPVVLTNLPVCGNCHSFSADGKTLGMDVDVGNDKGAYVLTSFEKETIFSRDKLISWSNFVRDVKVPTFGMLPRVSPNGRYVISGVKDRSVFLPRRDILFSQIFFPVMGILAYYDHQTGEIHALAGADDEEYVQANGVWTQDGKNVVFAKNRAAKLKAKGDKFKGIILNKEESIEVLGGEEFLEKPQETDKKFMYSLYKLPFNHGKGGKAEPIEGASNNGMSNYFPKFSPDGKWMVFTQAHSFMLLQPDSKLYIMPAKGGEPRLMNCNTNRMNSWHSWSPNSKWLVFSSKVFSPNTQLFLTHIDETGNDSPPILLRNFTPLNEDRGANIPEFVNIKPKEKRIIYERFLDDYNYFRSGRIYEQFRLFENAEKEYLKSLKINPRSTYSHYSLGTLYAKKEDYKKAENEFKAVAKLDPNNPIVHNDLGSLYLRMKEFGKAEIQFKTVLKLDPKNVDALFNLGSVYLNKKELDRAEVKFKTVLPLESEKEKIIGVHFNLANIYINKKEYQKAKTEFEKVISLEPTNIDAHHNLGNIYSIMKNKEKAKQEFETISKIDPSNVSAHLELGQLCAETNEKEKAIREFKTVRRLDPGNLFSQIYLGRLYTSLKDYDNAAKEYYDILDRDPDNIYAHINLGKMYAEMQDFKNAIKMFRKVHELNPRDATACFMLGELLSKSGDPTEEAISILKEGLTIKPNYFDGRILLGNLFLKTGDLDHAIQQFEIALKLNPNAPDLAKKIADLKKRGQEK